ncbi:copper chaperone PCu(A)C [Ruixingdingia sedimenti]|uniref:Copper chaperone PCu(A)C n=1 Tax=Ruixingdingia sedimenti TaxID=3073604 RepID=A0ABU1F5G2_9RHOB|nr:copper chaperone PCu(A)C [Xinfangfangia sp. LG-4]MDR5652102.1 copper chaperone PCu(A)C [Xinfangfangia sp. LG-4]
MKPMTSILAAAALALSALAAQAHDGLAIKDAYARSAGPGAQTGAAFMVIENHTAADDRLVSAASDAAAKVELHTHREENGVMKMVHVEEGFAIPAHGSHALARGGDHVMLMGLTRDLAQGDTITVTLTFETAGEMVVEIPVDNDRKADHGGAMKHNH